MHLAPTRDLTRPEQPSRPDSTPSKRTSRSRWAAVGAAIAVTIGSGGILTTSASIDSGERGVYVPIAPCRLFDTRPGTDNVGPRNTPLGPGDTFAATVRGTNGNCTIPTDAVGLTMNVAIVNPTTASFLTVFPPDSPRPLAANANWIGGQPPLSNAVTADISADGKVAFYNLAGTVDIAADIVGYYIDHTHDDRYYTKAQSDAAYATKAGANTLAIRGGSRAAVDSVGDVGSYSSIAIGTDSVPIISYFNDADGDLKVAKCVNTACTGAATITTLDATGTVGLYTSIRIGADGLPVISYWDSTNDDLKVAKCTNAACTAATLTSVDTAGSVGSATSIAIGADGFPIVSYYDFTNGSVKVAKCLNAACTGASTITTLDSIGDVGLETSIAVGADGLPIISYYDITNGNLKTAKCVNAACTGAPTISTLDAVGDTGRFSSIVIGIDGLPIMSYYDFGNDDLRVAKCLNAACTGVPTLTTLDAVGLVGEYTSIAIGVDGLPIISYQDSANTNDDLKVAACGNIDCTGGASIVVVETPGNVGQFTALAIGADGLPIISHLDATNLDLRVAKCATTTCVG